LRPDAKEENTMRSHAGLPRLALALVAVSVVDARRMLHRTTVERQKGRRER